MWHCHGSSCRGSFGTRFFFCLTTLRHPADWHDLTTSFIFTAGTLLPAPYSCVLHSARVPRASLSPQNNPVQTAGANQRNWGVSSKQEATLVKCAVFFKMPLLWLYLCFPLSSALIGRFLPHAATHRGCSNSKACRSLSTEQGGFPRKIYDAGLSLCPPVAPPSVLHLLEH